MLMLGFFLSPHTPYGRVRPRACKASEEREKKNLALALLLCEMKYIKWGIKNEWKWQYANKACAYSLNGE